MGKVPRKNVENAKSINMNYMNLGSRFNAISNNTKLERKTRQQYIKNHNYMGNKPNADLNFNSIIQTIQNNNNLIVIDTHENIKTKTSKVIVPNTADCFVINNSDNTINDSTDDKSQTMSINETTTYIQKNNINDIIDTTKNANIGEYSQTVSSKETALCSDNNEVINIIDTTIQSSLKSNSLNSTISFSDDIQMINYVSKKKPIECISLYDDGFMKQHNKNPMLEEKNITNIHKQRISQNNRQLKHRNVKIFQKTNVPSTLKETVKTNKQLRPIIIDGLNIGHAHGCGKFSVKGIELCIEYFANRGHQKIIAFIPHHQQRPHGSETNIVIYNLYKNGHICFTPSRKIHNIRMTCYDDRMILDYADVCGGVVVSNDNYRDLYDKKESFKDIIENRQVMITFVGDDIIVPDDQYNREFDVRTLSDILCFPE